MRQGTHFELPMATTRRAQRPKDWHPKIEELGAASQRVGFGMVGVLGMATWGRSNPIVILALLDGWEGPTLHHFKQISVRICRGPP